MPGRGLPDSRGYYSDGMIYSCVFVRMSRFRPSEQRVVCVVTPCEISRNPFAIFCLSVEKKIKAVK